MRYASPNHNDRKLPISMLVLHYTGMQSAEAALQRLCDPAAEVSAHYCIAEDGILHRLVDEQHRAWHAGKGWWRGIADINSASIGIELVNPGHEFGYKPFPQAQMEMCKTLCLEILSRHYIPARNVVGHSDIAPTRKQDPGELFPWKEFSIEGIGVWHGQETGVRKQVSGLTPAQYQQFVEHLATYGYDTSDATAAITAFHRHFYPQWVGEQPNEHSLDIISSLLKLG